MDIAALPTIDTDLPPTTPCMIVEFEPRPSFPGRVKIYDGHDNDVVSSLIADGFDPVGEVVAYASTMVQTASEFALLFGGTGSAKIAIGRKDPQDGTYADAATAIAAEHRINLICLGKSATQDDYLSMAAWCEDNLAIIFIPRDALGEDIETWETA